MLNPVARFMLNWGNELSIMMSPKHFDYLSVEISLLLYLCMYLISISFSIFLIRKINIVKAFNEE